MRTNSISKFLFCKFNTFRAADGEKPLSLRHSMITNDDYACETLQNKSWSYIIETLLHTSNEDVAYMGAIRNIEDCNIIGRTIDNLHRCKETYNTFFIKLAKSFKTTLEHMQLADIKEIQEDLQTKVYRAKDIAKNENALEVLQLFE